MTVSLRRRSTIVALCLSTLASLIRLYYLSVNGAIPVTIIQFGVNSPHLPTQDDQPQPCVGPQGLRITSDVHDAIDVGEYPTPLWGSFDALGLSKKWHSADSRYGPYGWVKGHYGPYGWVNEIPSNNTVRWNDVDWALLQNNCVDRNQRRFYHIENISPKTRIHMRPWWESLKPKVYSQRSRLTARTAIVLRAWDTYRYTQEDLLHIRSIISEAALGSGGRYAVFLLVHVKLNEYRRQLNKGQKEYDEVLAKVVPQEFRNMAVLFDETLLESWYALPRELE